ncbi:MAG: hypothetical protein DWH96_10995 [Planctomycetota bacterium]|nr:MAG: hypothetical protein DWH96_10995 [Planctomycetota bacterium]
MHVTGVRKSPFSDPIAGATAVHPQAMTVNICAHRRLVPRERDRANGADEQAENAESCRSNCEWIHQTSNVKFSEWWDP